MHGDVGVIDTVRDGLHPFNGLDQVPNLERPAFVVDILAHANIV